MPDFAWVEHALFTPTSCATCMTHKDTKGFVDLLVDTPIGGRLYMCATCVERAGKEVKMLSKRQGADLSDRLARAQNKILSLEEELAKEKAEKFVTLEDVKALMRPDAPLPKAKPYAVPTSISTPNP